MPEQYIYLFFVDLILLIVWGVLFIARKDTRREMLYVSSFIGILTLITGPLFLSDYWEPKTILGYSFSIEDFLFGFFTAGISAVTYEILFRKKYQEKKDLKHHWSSFLLPSIIGTLTLLLILMYVFNLNSIYALVISSLFLVFIFSFFRKDLLPNAIANGLIFTAIYFILFSAFLVLFPGVLEQWWKLEHLSSIFFLGIPVEELLWAFSWGAVCGPFYEFFTGLRYQKISS